MDDAGVPAEGCADGDRDGGTGDESGDPPPSRMTRLATEPATMATVEALTATAEDGLSVFDAVELVAAWHRVSAWAAAQSARAAAALAERDVMAPLWPDVVGAVARPGVAAEEISLRLGVSRAAAQDLIRVGRAAEGPLWPTGEAFACGDIDLLKARVLVRALEPVPGEVALLVQEQVLADAPRRTPRQLAADIQQALIEVDPREAEERAARAVDERRVCRPTVLPDGMAGMWAVLPAPAAVALHGELDAVARQAREAGDSRTLDQLRADALVAAVLARGPRPDDDARASVGIASRAAEAVTPTTSPGHGVLERLLAGAPLQAEVAVSVSLETLTGASSAAAHLEGYGPVARSTALALSLGGRWRRIVTDPVTGAVLDVGRTRYRPPQALEDHVRARDGGCVLPTCSTPATACQLDHTVPFGAVDGVASAAQRGPEDDEPSSSARGDGRTSADNLGALCVRDHLLKTHGGFHLRQSAPGVFEWVTPSGHAYVRHPRRVGAITGSERPVRTRRQQDGGDGGASIPPGEAAPF